MADIGARRWWALGAVTLAVLAVGLDATVLSVALPTLATALRASESDLQWFSSGYLLVLAAAMLPVGLVGDRYGRKTVLLGALALFGAASAGCASAQTVGEFIAARVALGVAGAGIVVMALSALTVLFTEAERPRAVGIWAAANFVALPLGPILGGWLLTSYWWGWVFLLNVPVAAIGLVAALALVPQSRSPRRPALDPLGVVTSTAGLVGVTYGLIEAGQNGWTDATAVGPMLGGVALLLVFVLWERRLTRRPDGGPLVDLALFRSRSFTWGIVLMATVAIAMTGVLFTLPQYFQAVLGTDALGSGLRLLPMIGGLVLGALPAARIARAVGNKVVVAAGFAILAGGAALGSTIDVGSGTAFIAAWTAAIGIGIGLVFSTAASAAIAELPQERSGVGSAVLQALQKVGAPLGTAVLGSVLSAAYRSRLDLAGLPPAAAAAVKGSVFGGIAVARELRSQALRDSVQAAFVHGMGAGLLASAAIAALGVVLTLAFLPGRPRPIAPDPQPAAAENRERDDGPRAIPR